MHSYVLQEWTTIRGQLGGSGQTIVQTERDWLDLSPFQDVFFWVDCREVTGAVSIQFETSPAPDDSLFQLVTTATMLAAGPAPTIVKAPMLSATTPLSRFLRWKLTGPASTWDATFRVLVAANSPGM